MANKKPWRRQDHANIMANIFGDGSDHSGRGIGGELRSIAYRREHGHTAPDLESVEVVRVDNSDGSAHLEVRGYPGYPAGTPGCPEGREFRYLGGMRLRSATPVSGVQKFVSSVLFSADWAMATELTIERTGDILTATWDRHRPVEKFNRRGLVSRSTEPTTESRSFAVVSSPLAVGDKAKVHSTGHWYLGEVVKVTAKVATVKATRKNGRSFTKTVAWDSGLIVRAS